MLRIGVSICMAGLALGLASCGAERSGKGTAAVMLPPSGHAYRALDRQRRTAVAASCRDRIAAAAHGVAARELHAVSPVALREQLDARYLAIAEQRRPVAAVCRELIPFVTPGLRLDFDGAKGDGQGGFSTETSSDARLRLSGRVTPAPAGAQIVARRDVGPPVVRRAPVGPEGRFRLPAVGLRKVADNTFTITIRAPGHAPHKALFTAICLDCLSGGPPPGSS